MKKIIFTFLALLTSCVFISNVNAANATISVKADKSNVVIGSNVKITVTVSSSTSLGSWDYTLNYNTSLFSLVSMSTDSLRNADYATSSGVKSRSYTYTFKALKSGSGNFTLSYVSVYDWDSESLMSTSAGSAAVKIITQAELEASYSKNNYLKSLVVENATLSPEFNKDTLEYTVELGADVTSINIIATKEDGTATVTGAGEIEVSEGANRIEIIVTAQNGNQKIYIINANVKELTPINVTVNDELYTIVRKKDALTKPSTFTETFVTIEGEEIPAFTSSITGYTLVGLKNSSGEIKLFIYDENDGTYEPYEELTLKGVIFSPIQTDKVPKGYKKSTIEINGISVDCFKINDSSDFVLLYGMNIENGHEGFYLYDKKDNTLQRYYQDEVDMYIKKADDYLFVAAVFGGALIISVLLIIIMATKKNKNKKIKMKKVKEDKKNSKEEKKEITEEETYNILEDEK